MQINIRDNIKQKQLTLPHLPYIVKMQISANVQISQHLTKLPTT